VTATTDDTTDDLTATTGDISATPGIPPETGNRGGAAGATDGDVPEHTGSQATRVLGLAALVSAVFWALHGLIWSPPEVDMGDVVRLLYVHVPAATLLYVACAITTISSAMWLRRRTPGWDALALSAAELAAVFGVLTLLTGSIWGRPTWGTYRTWDPHLTTTALLQVLIIGYLALRRVEPSGGTAGYTPAAIVGLLLLPNVVIVRYSVDWWRSLHQGATLNTLTPSIEGDMLVSLMLGLLTGGLVFLWLMIHRFRVAHLEQQVGHYDLEAAVAARRAEVAGQGLRPEGAQSMPDTDHSSSSEVQGA
jgi:heme exporter protein C